MITKHSFLKNEFLKNELLKNFTIIEMGNKKLVKLINEHVEILITIDSNDTIHLVGFDKQNTTKKGIARCGLLAMLEKLLDNGLINNNTIMYVSSPTPADGNLERLIRIYKEIGFKLGKPEAGNPNNLYSSIQNLVTTLKEQCELVNKVNPAIIAVEKMVDNSRQRNLREAFTSASRNTKKASNIFVKKVHSAISRRFSKPKSKIGGNRRRNRTRKRQTKRKKTKKRKSKRRRK